MKEKNSGDEKVSNLLTATWLISAQTDILSQSIVKLCRPRRHLNIVNNFALRAYQLNVFCLKITANSLPTGLSKSYLQSHVIKKDRQALPLRVYSGGLGQQQYFSAISLALFYPMSLVCLQLIFLMVKRQAPPGPWFCLFLLYSFFPFYYSTKFQVFPLIQMLQNQYVDQK